jgi:glycosyltransferase involved in cell wall biosynthesis
MSALYVDQTLRSVGHFDDAVVAACTERHPFRIPPVDLKPASSLESEIDAPSVRGVVFALTAGLPGRRVVQLARRGLRRKRSVFLYWPAENAIEVIDRERLSSIGRHRLAYMLGTKLIQWRQRRKRQDAAVTSTAATSPTPATTLDLGPAEEALKFIAADFASTRAHLGGGFGEIKRLAELADQVQQRLDSVNARLSECASIEEARDTLAALTQQVGAVRTVATSLVPYMDGGDTALQRIDTNLTQLVSTIASLKTTTGPATSPAPPADTVVEDYKDALAAFRGRAAPVPFRAVKQTPTVQNRIPGTGVYLRTDYWAHLVSGGSYGHTCYVAQELAKITENFLCLMGNRFLLLDELGLQQEIVGPRLTTTSERDLLQSNLFYYDALRARLSELCPAYVFERLVLGNFAAARVCCELGIPYIVEYNGSEISMRHSFGSGAMAHEDLFIEAEQLAFQQATAITAISDHVCSDIVRRGIDPGKVVINPNGVNCSEYASPSPDEKQDIRAALGFAPDDRVVGFIGTFGGWHGIDVLAAALPEVCRRMPKARFLLIGDGNLKHLVTDAIREHGLSSKVVDVGRTDQRLGARYLKAADIYVSPHASHMRDSKFFGSPTKLFEYMALGGGIVASDLEQIGMTLAPSLRPSDFAHGMPLVREQRAVLCRPGDIDDFIAGVVALVEYPEAAAALGRNARIAAITHFSWERHVSRIWEHVLGLRKACDWRPIPTGAVSNG